ncbi:SDR family oxidoreductase [Streptomyces sp. JH14]|uniref:SDR family NAD(P)-dependent oxidoreductase n=1 Tax=Streptomyces sp. JH14 TaxID=2793630 RepID=UPI0023FA404D|nr:SDR family oxidoreductase [Streptomyces sp. JH14]MDF6040700.1 SDR family oxidoreductase [Streptomyces sp. JH14]
MRKSPPTRGTPTARADATLSAAGRPPARSPRPVVLITGASSGIGAEVASRLAGGGRWELLLNGRDEDRLDGVAARTAGTALPMDLAAEDGCRRLAEAALAHSGRVDALVAGAGLGWAGAYTAMPAATVDRLVSVNVCAVLHLVRLVLPQMVARGSGRLVLIGSVAGRFGVRGEAVYAATKGALIAFAESLRYELRGTGVQVCLVLPGPVDTPFFTRRGTPYSRSWPRPVPAGLVAAAVEEALAGGRDEITVPRWLGVPGRIQGVAPHLFRRLAMRFG